MPTKIFCFASGLLALVSFAISAPAKSDSAVDLAPPVASAPAPSSSSDMIFNWKEIPVDTKVPLTKATFDQGGYQLYDEVGETIVVPFDNNNLYVMKFAQTTEPNFYFTNQDGVPVLYVPAGGYLENAAVPGATWFPFSEKFHPAQPVFIGIAPSWTAFVSMAWYPNMVVHCGYWTSRPYVSGVIVTPAFAFSIVLGGTHYHGWNPYLGYVRVHPAPFHPVMIHDTNFHWGAPAFSYVHRDVMFGHHDDGHGFHGDRPGDHGGWGGGSHGDGGPHGGDHHDDHDSHRGW